MIKNQRLRKILKITIPIIFIPAVVILGVFVFDEKKYVWITIAVAMLTVLLFYTGFEKKATKPRRIVVVSVLTALSVLGRFVFAPIPAFKPITAMVVITAIWMGGESGFLVGSLSAVISNFYFGQGPWTPFQMLSWGLIGLLAGYLSKALKNNRFLLALYGVFAGVAYSLIMDVWNVLWYDGSFHWSLYLASLITAIPFSISYAVSNVVFLLLLGKPFGEKLERVKIKYNI